MKRILLEIFLAILLCSAASAQTSVWKIEKGPSVFFLGGTCHLLRPSDFPLPPEFDRAYRASDLLVFETDLRELNSPETQRKLMSKTLYSDGSTLDQHLSPQTYERLKRYCEDNGIPVELLRKFKPSVLAVMMEAAELAKLNATSEGVDLHFYHQAKRDGKAVKGLETIDEQIGFIAEMGRGDEDGFVRHALQEVASMGPFYESLVAAWKQGNTERIHKLMIADFQNTPKLYKSMLTDRNENWLPRIDAYGQTPQKEFFLVGIGHLVGPDGILASLRRKGYKVEKF